jgi:hypothetical protein
MEEHVEKFSLTLLCVRAMGIVQNILRSFHSFLLWVGYGYGTKHIEKFSLILLCVGYGLLYKTY